MDFISFKIMRFYIYVNAAGDVFLCFSLFFFFLAWQMLNLHGHYVIYSLYLDADLTSVNNG